MAVNSRKRARYSEVHSPELTLSQGSVDDETLDCSEWSCDGVVSFLQKHGHADVAEKFRDEEIDGELLPDVQLPTLHNMGIRSGKSLKILQLLRRFRRDAPLEHSYKIFNDPIHGHIELDPLCVQIIDTPQFQRLRYIKQLGGCYFVFPGASHNRFEHSLGVCFLAGRLVGTLHKRQPELGITEQDILCVKIAGLCHDLGHGPFSHMFDSMFIPRIRPDRNWRHEDASVQMFEHLIECNHVDFKKYGLNDLDLEFIKEQIAGPRPTTNPDDWPYKGRDKSKAFLYEIVANKRNGIDVDKWDYFARDCHCLGIANNFDHRRFMKFTRVLSHNDCPEICTRDKEVHTLYDLFHARNTLHRRAYQHKTSNVIEIMITEALIKANDYLFVPGKDGQKVKMSDAIEDMEAYTKLTDYVFHQILLSDNENLQEAKEILQKIERRELYRCVAECQVYDRTFSEKDRVRVAEQIVNTAVPVDDDNQEVELVPDDVVVDFVKFDYGMGKKDPIESVRFYMKNHPDRAVNVRKEQVSQMLPREFAELHIRVYSRKRDKSSCDAVFSRFEKWCKDRGCSVPKGGDIDPELTPYKTPVKLRSESHSSLLSAATAGTSIQHAKKSLFSSTENRGK